MSLYHAFSKSSFLKRSSCLITYSAGLKNIKKPPNYDHIILPETRRLPLVEKVPQFIGNTKMPRCGKELDLIRGPEEVHNTLIHKQFGIVATAGGRLTHRHFEMIRFVVSKRMDMKKMFAIWRIDPPWLPVTKKGVGQRMGGGKGAINHYVTPIKSGRIIIEIGGHADYEEVLPILKGICARTPMTAIPCNEEILENIKKQEDKERTENINPYTAEYLIKNNIGNCRRWATKYDFKYFGKHL